MKTKAILAALMLMVCGMASAQKFMNVKTAEGKYVSFKVTPELKVTWDSTPQAATPIENALPGKFNVGDDKYVYFSKGNLYYNGTDFCFEENQYSIATTWNTSHVSNFHWAENPAVAYAISYNNSDAAAETVLFTNKEGFTVAGQTDVWVTLTKAEWIYLFEHYASKNMSVCSKNGVVIAPAGVTNEDIPDSYDADTWAKAESEGFVFLPSTGYRTGSGITNSSSEFIYWGSTPKDDDEADRLLFKPDGTQNYNTTGYKYWGAGIRLVTTQSTPNIINE